MQPQNDHTSYLDQRALPLAAFAVLFSAFAQRFFTAIIPTESLVGLCLADDAFYYLKIAQNILAGNGATFDGQILTNGFHPLYMAVCVAIEAIAQPYTVFAVTIFFTLVGTINTLLIYLLGKKLGGDLAGLFAAFFWGVSPWVYLIELMGVEAALAVCFALLSTLLWTQIRAGEKSGYKSWALLGLLVGLTFLARTDTGFFAIFLAIDVLFVHRKNLAKALSRMLLAGTISLLVVGPWLIWSLLKFGTIMQDSGRALYSFTRLDSQLAGLSFFHIFKGQLSVALNDQLLPYTGFANPWAGFAFVVAISFAGISCLFFKDRFAGLKAGAMPFVMAGFVTWGFYIFYFWNRKQWYFLFFLAACALIFGRILSFYINRSNKFKWVIALVLAVLLGYNWLSYSDALKASGIHGWQKQYFAIAQKLKRGEYESIKPDDVLGAWNSGIYGYFSGHRVINLDGVVNPEAILAVSQKRFLAYLQEKKIVHVIDHELMFRVYSPYCTKPFGRHMKFRAREAAGTSAGDILILSVGDQPWKKIQPGTDPKTD